ncbi:MAG: TIGR03013 family PEP-CTERM/XrtA system glycosyltransferase [Desulfobacteraceae bacterium]|nr:MAG: TIGR03013 family PEP-CTERM/XrtA system glycosyltransferase [Desulfobacteraceae bacterium]
MDRNDSMKNPHEYLNRDILVLLLGDILIAAFCCHSILSLQTGWLHFGLHNQTNILSYVCILILCSLSIELYHIRTGQLNFLLRILSASVFAFIVFTSMHHLLYVFPDMKTIYHILVIFFGLQWVWHFSFITIKNVKSNRKQVLILGSGQQAKIIGSLIDNHKNGYRLAGYVQTPELPLQVPRDQILGLWDRLLNIIEKVKPQLLVVCLKEKRGILPLEDILASKFNGIEIYEMVTFYEKLTGKLLIEHTTPGWFIFSGGFKTSISQRIAQEILNKLLATIGLSIILPFFPLAALMIKLDSPGPVFYRQVRIGHKGRSFILYKLRTMVDNAETCAGAQWACENDPRITKSGRLLRKMRMDELPQLYNVLKGDLSIVGPRPERPEFIERLKKVIPYYEKRHFVKPGVTGWAQINYPYGASEKDALEKLRFDLYYIKHFSILFDLTIIWKTFGVVLEGRGAR